VMSEWCHQHPLIHLRFRGSNLNRRVPDNSVDVPALGLGFLLRFLTDERAAVVLVTKVLQDICPSVIQYLPTCYAELIE
jgi:hypothetical protein